MEQGLSTGPATNVTVIAIDPNCIAAVFRQAGGHYLIYYSGELHEWLNTEFHAGNTTSGLSIEGSSYCADSEHPWVYYNGSDWVRSRDVITSCAAIK